MRMIELTICDRRIVSCLSLVSVCKLEILFQVLGVMLTRLRRRWSILADAASLHYYIGLISIVASKTGKDIALRALQGD